MPLREAGEATFKEAMPASLDEVVAHYRRKIKNLVELTAGVAHDIERAGLPALTRSAVRLATQKKSSTQWVLPF